MKKGIWLFCLGVIVFAVSVSFAGTNTPPKEVVPVKGLPFLDKAGPLAVKPIVSSAKGSERSLFFVDSYGQQHHMVFDPMNKAKGVIDTLRWHVGGPYHPNDYTGADDTNFIWFYPLAECSLLEVWGNFHDQASGGSQRISIAGLCYEERGDACADTCCPYWISVSEDESDTFAISLTDNLLPSALSWNVAGGDSWSKIDFTQYPPSYVLGLPADTAFFVILKACPMDGSPRINWDDCDGFTRDCGGGPRCAHWHFTYLHDTHPSNYCPGVNCPSHYYVYYATDPWSYPELLVMAVVKYPWGALIPDIRVEPDSLVFSVGTGSGEFGPPLGHQTPSGKQNGSIKSPQNSSGYHSMGLIIPEEVVQYWQTDTPLDYSAGKTLKSSVDWSSDDSPVKDQGGCGSCWAFATVALIENLGNHKGLSDQDLSEQVLVSCDTQNYGCNGGWYGYALQYVNEDSLPPESCYPYIASDGNCDDKCDDPLFLEYVTEYDKYGRWGDPDGSTVNDLRALLNDAPVLVAMDVPTDGSFTGYSGGIYNYNGGWFDPTDRGHAVLAAGYDDAQQYFKAKNSWGSSWGENGYFRIAYDDVTDYTHFGGYACVASGVYKKGGDISSSITVYNDGTGNLVVSNINYSSGWLSVSPTSFTVTPGNSQLVTAQVDTTGLASGTYHDRLLIYSNDPDESPYPDGVYVTLIKGGPSCDSLWVVSDTASVGQRGKVIRVFGKNCSELSGYSVCMKFDPDVIEVDTLTLEGTRGEGATMFIPGWTDTTAKAGIVYVYSCPGIPPGEGPLLNLVVNIKDDAQVGPTTLELVDVPPALNRFSPCEGGAIIPTLVNGTLEVVREMFVRGDDDVDGELTISDPILSLCYQFADCPQPSCMDACDVDDDGEVTISDPIRNLCYQFADCDPPPPPFPNCGPDPTEDGLDCASYPPCGTKVSVSAKKQISKSGGKIEVGKVCASTGGKVVVPVYLTNAQPLSGFAYTIRYDNSVLTAISAQDSGLVTEGFDFSSAKINNEEGWVRVGNVVSYGVSSNLPAGIYQVARITFSLDEEQIKDNVALELVDGQFVDMEAKLTRPKLVGGVIKAGTGLPKIFDLSQNYPNPFNPVTEISYQLPQQAKVTICIYNTMGQLVRTLVNEEQPAGFRAVKWAGKDNRGGDVSSGVYFCRMRADGFIKTRKMVLLR